MRAAAKKVSIMATCALLSMALSVGCGFGGGGGGGEKSDPGGITRFDLEYGDLDTGNFTEVRMELSDINEEGVILKLHYSSSLAYSKSSALLYPGEDEQRAITPFIEDTNGNERYLVFFLFPDTENGNDIRLKLKLKAVAADDEAYLEAGLNNNDPNISDDKEFVVTDPLFAALERHEINIYGTSAEPTAVPTATGSAVATSAATAAVTTTAAATTAGKMHLMPGSEREADQVVSAVLLPDM